METARQLRDTVHLDILAECLYETAVLCDRVVYEPEERAGWSRLSTADKCKYRYAATAALNGLSPSRRHEAELRSREQVAHLPHIGRAFHLLPGAVQRQIVFTVQAAVHTYLRVLEGLFQPLPASLAIELEPSSSEDEVRQ